MGEAPIAHALLDAIAHWNGFWQAFGNPGLKVPCVGALLPHQVPSAFYQRTHVLLETRACSPSAQVGQFEAIEEERFFGSS